MNDKSSLGARIEVDDVSCTFRQATGSLVHALRGVSLTIPPGQFVGIVGRSGHGKSTFLRVLAGLQQPSGGQIRVNDVVVAGPGSDRGMVFQQDTVFPWMRVRANVEYGPRVRGVTEKERRRLSDHWIKQVGLEGFEDAWPRELSGGMRKRVALAAVCAAEASVWLMDEPFGALDYFTRRALHEVVLEVWAMTKKTVLFVTHDMEEALILSDRIILIHEGRIVGDLNVDLPRPRTEEVRATRRGVELERAMLGQIGVQIDASTGGDPSTAEGASA